MHISWGTKLTIVFALFAASMSYMVYQCFNVPVNLVSDSYYRDEIAYQQVIDGTNNANGLATKVAFLQNSNEIVLQLPAEMKNYAISGSVLFYCSSNSAKDKKFNLQQLQNGQMVIKNNGQLAPGSYVVKTDWWANKMHYHNEQPVKIL